MGPNAVLEVTVDKNKLTARLIGTPFFDLGANPVVLQPTSTTEFYVDSRYQTVLSFSIGSDGKALALTVNPGRWAERGERIK